MSQQSAVAAAVVVTPKEVWKQRFTAQWCELLDGNPHVPNVLAWAELLHGEHGEADPEILARTRYVEMREKLLGRYDASAPSSSSH